MADLKLLALDAEDLAVVSAHLQDAILRVGDMAFVERARRFAMLCNRFDAVAPPPRGFVRRRYTRRQSGLRFERVLAAQSSGIDPKAKDTTLVLLSVGYEPLAGQEPEGYITLLFAGQAAVRLHVECIEAELKDLGAAWRTARKPDHDG